MQVDQNSTIVAQSRKWPTDEEYQAKEKFCTWWGSYGSGQPRRSCNCPAFSQLESTAIPVNHLRSCQMAEPWRFGDATQSVSIAVLVPGS